MQVLQQQLVSYLQAQRQMLPGVVVSIFAAVTNLLGGLFVVLGVGVHGWDGLGFIACPWVTTVVQWATTTLLVSVFFVKQKLHVPTWPGWQFRTNVTRERIVAFLRLYVPAMLQFASEFWRYVHCTGHASPPPRNYRVAYTSATSERDDAPTVALVSVCAFYLCVGTLGRQLQRHRCHLCVARRR